MANQVSVSSTGAIDREEVAIIGETGLREELPVIDNEASTLAAKAESNVVQSALDEGQHVSTIENTLVSKRGMEQQDARNLLVDTLQPTIKSAVEEHGEDVLRQILATEYTYPENLINDLFGGRTPVTEDSLASDIIRKSPPQLVPVAEEADISGDDLGDLTTLARNVYELQMPMFQGLYANIFKDPDSMAKYQQTVRETNYAIANTLRKLGKNVEVAEDGTLIDVETGAEVDTDFLDSIAAAEGEIAGAIGGAAGGGFLAKLAKIGSSSTPWGRFANYSLIALGATIGSAGGASLGRALDVVRNAMLVKQDIEANFVVERMKDAGVFDITAAIVGTPILYAGSQLLRGIGRSYDLFIGGNTVGAYNALKQLMHLTDEQVDETMKAWEKVTGNKIKGSRRKRALTIIPQTEASGEAILRTAASINPKASVAITRSIDQRAKDLMKATRELTNDNIDVVLQDELSKYTSGVKNYYAGIKDFATDSMKDVPYKFDYSKLALDPIMKSIDANLTNPAIKERFANYMAKIQSLGQPGEKMRSFDNLLELRNTINEFKRVTHIRSKKDFDAINAVIGKVDNEVAKVAKEQMPNGKAWLQSWKQANIEYSKMLKLRENVLYKALTKPGVNIKKIVQALSSNITAIDGTFMQVIAKLPPRVRDAAEGAVLDTLAKKHTVGFEKGFQVTHFPNLNEELKRIGFTTTKARNLKRVVNELAEVFKNVVDLPNTSQITKSGLSGYLSDRLDSRFRYELINQIFNRIKRTFPTTKGRQLALIMKTAKLLENPQSSVAIKDLLKSLPDDPELTSKVRQLALEHAKFGQKDISPQVPVYRIGTPGVTHKVKDGPLGKGTYWNVDKTAIRRQARRTGGKVVQKKILPSRIATEQNIKDTLGVEDFDPKLLKDDPRLIKLLKNRGYDGVSLGTVIVMFK